MTKIWYVKNLVPLRDLNSLSGVISWLDLYYICIVYYSIIFPWVYIIYRYITTSGWILLRNKLAAVCDVGMWPLGSFLFLFLKLKRPVIMLGFSE